MAVSEDKKLEILNDHYKDTFLHIKGYIKSRERLFFFALVILTFQFFQISSPDESTKVISVLIEKKFGAKISSISQGFVNNLLWFILLSIVLKYFQTTVFIERQYNYIHELEDKLSDLSGEEMFTREGKSYLEDYPGFSKWVHRLYTWIFPILLLMTVTLKILIEFSGGGLNFAWGMSFILFVAIWVTTILYLYFRFCQVKESKNTRRQQ